MTCVSMELEKARCQRHGVQVTSLGWGTSVQMWHIQWGGGAGFVFKIIKYNASFLLFPVLNVIILYFMGALI